MIFFSPVLSNAIFINAITEVIASGKEWEHFISHLPLLSLRVNMGLN